MPTISEKRIFKLLGTLYDASQNGSSDFWTPIYSELADILDAGPGSVSLFLTSENKFTILAANTDQAMFDEYDKYYQHISPFRSAITKLKAGESFHRVHHCSDEEFEKMEIYQKYFRRYNIFRHEYHVLYKSPDITGGVSFSRPKSRPEFSVNERNALNFILPHLQRVFQFHVAATEARRETLQMSEALKRVHQSVIVVDKDLRIVFSNAAAQKLIDKNDGLAVSREKRLFATSPGPDRELRKLLDGIFRRDGVHNGRTDAMMQLSRPSGLRALQVQIFPFTEQDFKSYAHEILALLFVYDPEQRIETLEEVLIKIYALTPAEARLAGLLSHGTTLQEACEILDVKPNTVRTHLKHIFCKTHTNRQSDLIRLALTGPGMIANL